MRKNFLILSVVLATAVGAVFLQSCSSDYEYYATEEYGYYTEEEIEYIDNLAKQLNVNVKANPNYYGEKSSVAEIEADIRGLASLIGKHEMVSSSANSASTVKAKEVSDLSRVKTRSLEAPTKGYWYCIDQSSVYGCVIDVDIQWDLSASSNSKKVSGSAKVQSYTNNNISGQSSLNCSLSGISVLFGGQIKSGASSKYQFHFEIVHGTLNLATSTGSFDVISY